MCLPLNKREKRADVCHMLSEEDHYNEGTVPSPGKASINHVEKNIEKEKPEFTKYQSKTRSIMSCISFAKQVSLLSLMTHRV